MSDRVRAVALGLGLAVAPLLLLDLGGTLTDAVQRDPGATSVWWPVACFVATGIVVAVGVGLARRDRIVAIVAAALVSLVAIPLVPADATRWLADLPSPTLGNGAGTAAVFLIVGAYVYAAVRGPQA